MNAENQKITQKQEAFLLELMQHPTTKAACEKCGISYETARGWLKKEPVRARFNELRAEVVEQGIAALTNRLGLAVSTMTEIMQAENAGYYTRGYASKTVIDAAVTVYKQTSLEDRLTALEGKAREMGRL